MAEYIERNALMDHIELNAREYGEDYDAWQILGDVEDFPAADVVEVKHGRWEYDDFVSPTIHCSVCKRLAPWNVADDYHSERTNYCPNCGAKMDLEESK